jgi:hypothetical protein
VLLIAAAILAARKLAQYDAGKRVPAMAIVNAQDGLARIVVTVKNAGARFATSHVAFLGNGGQNLGFLSERESNPFHAENIRLDTKVAKADKPHSRTARPRITYLVERRTGYGGFCWGHKDRRYHRQYHSRYPYLSHDGPT